MSFRACQTQLKGANFLTGGHEYLTDLDPYLSLPSHFFLMSLSIFGLWNEYVLIFLPVMIISNGSTVRMISFFSVFFQFKDKINSFSLKNGSCAPCGHFRRLSTYRIIDSLCQKVSFWAWYICLSISSLSLVIDTYQVWVHLHLSICNIYLFVNSGCGKGFIVFFVLLVNI